MTRQTTSMFTSILHENTRRSFYLFSGIPEEFMSEKILKLSRATYLQIQRKNCFEKGFSNLFSLENLKSQETVPPRPKFQRLLASAREDFRGSFFFRLMQEGPPVDIVSVQDAESLNMKRKIQQSACKLKNVENELFHVCLWFFWFAKSLFSMISEVSTSVSL